MNSSQTSLACSKKYRYDARHNLYTFVLYVSEAFVGCSIKVAFVNIEIPSKLTEIWGNDIVSLGKNHKIPEKLDISKHALTKRISLTATFRSKMYLKVYHVSCPEVGCFHRF